MVYDGHFAAKCPHKNFGNEEEAPRKGKMGRRRFKKQSKRKGFKKKNSSKEENSSFEEESDNDKENDTEECYSWLGTT